MPDGAVIGLHTCQKMREKNDESFTNANLWPSTGVRVVFQNRRVIRPGQMFAEWGAEGYLD